MQSKVLKIVLIILLIVVAIILISFMIFAIINKDKNYRVSFFTFGDKTKKLYENEYNIEEIRNIVIDTSSSNVKFQESDTDKVKVTVYGYEDEEVNVILEGDKLKIKKENNVFRIICIAWCKEEVLIEIPKSYNHDIEIKTFSGNVEMTDLKEANIQIQISSGNVTCGNMKNAIMQASSGEIKIGEVENAEIKIISGNMKVEKANSIKGTTTSGNIEVNHIDEFCELSCTSGDIKVESCILNQDSIISVKSGNVKISNLYDVYVEAKATSGNVKVENNDRKSDTILKITTISGNINVN